MKLTSIYGIPYLMQILVRLEQLSEVLGMCGEGSVKRRNRCECRNEMIGSDLNSLTS